MANLIKNIRQIQVKDAVFLGNKAYSLARLIKKFNVPNGFVLLSTFFEEFLNYNNLKNIIQEILLSSRSKKKKSEEISKLILKSDFSESQKKNIFNYFSRLKSPFVSVRSSALSEDSAKITWAGQLDTFLNVDQENLLEKIKMCWASLYSYRSISYAKTNKFSLADTSMAIIIQQMVPSSVSGIVFSVNPSTQNPNEILINAGYGLGESIVSGKITADEYLIHKVVKKILSKQISNQEVGLFISSADTTYWKKIPENKACQQKITDTHLLKITQIVIDIEKEWKTPVDVEFAFYKNNFYILQVRPITTLNQKRKQEQIPKSWERHGLPLFSQECFEGLMCSNRVLQKYFKYEHTDSTEISAYIDEWLCFSPTFTDQSRDLYYQAYANKDFTPFLKIGDMCRRHHLELNNQLDAYRYHDITLDQLKYLLTFTQNRIKDDMVLVDMLMDLSDLVEKDLSDLLYRKKIKNISECVSVLSASEYLTAFEKEAKSMQNLYEFAKRHKNWAKNPDFKKLMTKHLSVYAGITIRAMHGNYMTEDDVYKRIKEHLKSQKKFFEKDIAQIKQKTAEIFKRYHFNKFEKHFIAFVKEANFLRTHILDMYHWLGYRYREIFDIIGKPYGLTGNDFRNLMPQEILDWFAHKIEFPHRQDTNWIWYRIDDKSYVVDTPKEIDIIRQKIIQKENNNVVNQNAVFGTVVFHGVVQGPVRVVKNIKEIKKIRKGDIVVSPMTAPSAVLALEKAAGFVTDEGGALCHAAILAREMKKPCITGTKRATQIFKDDDWVELNTNSATVYKISKTNQKLKKLFKKSPA